MKLIASTYMYYQDHMKLMIFSRS